MNIINGLTSTVTKNADKLGYIAGILSENNIDLVVSSIQQLAAGVIHAPDMSQVQYWAQGQGKTALFAYLAGLAVDAINIPKMGNIGKALQEGAVAYAISTGAIRVFNAMTHSETKGVNILNSSIQQNFSQAPPTSALMY